MHFFAKYIEPHKDPEKPDKIKRLYNNYEVCKNCKARNKCLTGKQTHKTITEYGSEMQKAMNEKMEKQEKLDKSIFYVVIPIGILMLLLQNGGKKKQKRSE